jgi:hypothetical protein
MAAIWVSLGVSLMVCVAAHMAGNVRTLRR